MLTAQTQQLEGGITCIEHSDPHALVAAPLVSVVMITYNHGPYIAEAIEGVLAQQVSFPVELLIGEDRSTDNTMEVAMAYARKRPDAVRIVTSESNVGARSNGWRIQWSCRGKYMAFCEGDDYWHDPLKLTKQVDILESDPECVLVHTDIDMLYQKTNKRVERVRQRLGLDFTECCSRSERFNRLLCNKEVVYTPTVCVRRALHHEILLSDPHVFKESYFPMGDTPRWLELARRGTFRYINQSTTTFRRLPESASRSRDMRRLALFTVKSIEIRRYYADKYGCDGATLERMMHRLGWAGLRRACLAGDAELARTVRSQLSELSLTQKLFYYCSQSALCRGLYRWIDAGFIRARRAYRRWRYGVESSV